MLVSLGQQEEALVAYDSAIGLDHLSSEVWREKGVALITLGRYQEAAESLRRALTINPLDENALLSYSYVLVDLEEYEESLHVCRRVKEINPALVNGWNNEGYALLYLKRFDEALASFKRASEMDPQYANAWRGKGRALRELGKLDAARDCIDKALLLNPSYAAAKYDLAALLARCGLQDEALTAYEEAMAHPALSNECHEEALEFYTRLTEDDPRDACSHWGRRGELLTALNRFDEAMVAYDEALKLNCDFVRKSNWTAKGFRQSLSPDLIADRFLDVEIIILLAGANSVGNPMFSYVRINGRNLRRLFTKMESGENFKPDEFGVVVVSGPGHPTERDRLEMQEKHGMNEVPIPRRVSSLIEPDSPEE